MGEHQPLPVPVQHVLGAGGGQLQAAPPGERLQQQVNLGIVAQGLVVAHALHRGGDGLPVDDAAGAEGDRQAEALGRQRLENLQLNLPHELDVDLPQPLVPHEVELGILLLQQEELAQGGVGILPLGEEHLVDEHRLQGGGQGLRLCPKALPGGGAAQAGDGHHASRLGLVHGLEPGPRVDAQLIRLLRPAGAGEGLLHPQGAAGELHPRQAVPLVVPGNLEHPGGKIGAIPGPGGVRHQPLEEFGHPLQLQGGAEPAGEEPPPGDKGGEGIAVQRPVLQIALQRVLAAEGGRLVPLRRRGGEVHAPLVQPGFQPRQQGGLVRPRQIHLVDKQEGGHAVALQQPPEGVGVALHAVGAADDQDGAVQHLEGALHLAGKVRVTRRVQQGELRPVHREHRLLGKDSNAPGALHGVGVQKGVLVIHPPQLFQAPAGVEQPLAEGGFPRVHMGQNAYNQFVHSCRPLRCDTIV